VAPREIRELRIPLDLYGKLLGKGITLEEVREAVANAPRVLRGPKNSHPDQKGQAYFVVGRTDSGRPLKVLVRRFEDGGAMVITAWQPKQES